MAAFVTDVLKRAGFEVNWHEPAPERVNVDARMSRGRGRRLIFQSHGDTKPAVAAGAESTWTFEPFTATEDAGLLYGLGACDTKGGLAAQLAAACTLAEQPDWSGELVVQVVADEEDGSRLGAEYLLGLGLLDGHGAIVAEPTGCRPSLAQLGLAWAEVSILGRAAHAGTPERGRDAFRTALHYVAVLDALLVDSSAADPAFPGHPRLNIGAFEVPGHPGSVPGQCSFRCDIRVLPGRRRDDVLSLYDQAAEVIRHNGVTVTVEPYQGGGRPSHRIAFEHPLVQAFVAAHKRANETFATAPFAGGTDALYFAEAGTPAVVFGPGSLDQAHAPDEFVPLEELTMAYERLTAVALNFLRNRR